jgi:hypothetical protein
MLIFGIIRLYQFVGFLFIYFSKIRVAVIFLAGFQGCGWNYKLFTCTLIRYAKRTSIHALVSFGSSLSYHFVSVFLNSQSNGILLFH